MKQPIEKIEEMFEQIDGEARVPVLRRRVAALIAESLPELERTPTYWVKASIVHACRDLNANAQRGDSVMWLRRSLINLHQAYLSPNEYDEDYCPRDPAIDRMTVKGLSAAVKELTASIAFA